MMKLALTVNPEVAPSVVLARATQILQVETLSFSSATTFPAPSARKVVAARNELLLPSGLAMPAGLDPARLDPATRSC